MDAWKNKVAVVTGASAGIGAAIAKALVESGINVVGLARRSERIDQLASELRNQPGKLYSYKTDLTKEEDILEAFKWITKNVGPVSILINNAGIFQINNLSDGDTSIWRKVMDTNVMAVAIASREAIRSMNDNKIDGYIININSIAGQFMVDLPGLNVYSASKHALKAMTETLRLELARLKSNIRVTSVSPGAVKTEVVMANAKMSKEKFEQLVKMINILEPEDLAQSVLYLLSTPLRVQVTEITIRPLREAASVSNATRDAFFKE